MVNFGAVIKPEPYVPRHRYWEWLSLLCLPVDRQEIHIGFVSESHMKSIKIPYKSSAELLARALVECAGWYDEFYPHIEKYLLFNDELHAMLKESNEGFQHFSRSGFYHSPRWQMMRILAKEVLKEVGIPEINEEYLPKNYPFDDDYEEITKKDVEMLHAINVPDEPPENLFFK